MLSVMPFRTPVLREILRYSGGTPVLRAVLRDSGPYSGCFLCDIYCSRIFTRSFPWMITLTLSMTDPESAFSPLLISVFRNSHRTWFLLCYDTSMMHLTVRVQLDMVDTRISEIEWIQTLRSLQRHWFKSGIDFHEVSGLKSRVGFFRRSWEGPQASVRQYGKILIDHERVVEMSKSSLGVFLLNTNCWGSGKADHSGVVRAGKIPCSRAEYRDSKDGQLRPSPAPAPAPLQLK